MERIPLPVHWTPLDLYFIKRLSCTGVVLGIDGNLDLDVGDRKYPPGIDDKLHLDVGDRTV